MIVGHTEQQPNIPTAGEVFGLKKLLPQTLEYDCNFHVMVGRCKLTLPNPRSKHQEPSA
jgi:hypothetical protein